MNAFLLSIIITVSREIFLYIYRKWINYEYLYKVPFFGLSSHATLKLWNCSIYCIFLIVFALMIQKLLSARRYDIYPLEPNIRFPVPDDESISGPHGDIADNTSSSSDE